MSVPDSYINRKSAHNDAFKGEQIAQHLGQAQHGVQRRYGSSSRSKFLATNLKDVCQSVYRAKFRLKRHLGEGAIEPYLAGE